MLRSPVHGRAFIYLSVSTTCFVTVGLINSMPVRGEPPRSPGSSIIPNAPSDVTGSIVGRGTPRRSPDPSLTGGNVLAPGVLNGAGRVGLTPSGTSPSGSGGRTIPGVDPGGTTLAPGIGIPPIRRRTPNPLDPGFTILPPGGTLYPLDPGLTPLPGGSPSPGGGTPSPGGGTPSPGGGTPSPGGGTPSPGGGTPSPGGGTPSPGGGTPSPGGGTPPGGRTPGGRTPGGRTPTPTDPGARTPLPGTSPSLPPGGPWPTPLYPPTVTLLPPAPPVFVPVPVPTPVVVPAEPPLVRTISAMPIEIDQPHTLTAVIGKLHCGKTTDAAASEGGADQLCVAIGTLVVYDDGSTRIFGDCFGYAWDGREFNFASGFNGGPYTQHPIFCVNEINPSASSIETAAAGKRISYIRVAVALFEFDLPENPPVSPDSADRTFDGLLGRRTAMTSELATYSILDFGASRRSSMASNEIYWGRDVSDVGQIVQRAGSERMTNAGRENDLIGISEWVFTPADLRELTTHALQFRNSVPTAAQLQAQHAARPDYRGIRCFVGNGDQSNYDGEIWFAVVPQTATNWWTVSDSQGGDVGTVR